MDASLLAILVCPACRQPLVDDRQTLICSGSDCRRRYPVRDQIPTLIADKAEVMDVAEWENKVKTNQAK